MLTSVIFFVVFVLAIVVMVFFRVWELRVGRLFVDEEKVPDRFFQIDKMEREAERLIRKANTLFFNSIFLSLSHAIIFMRHLRDAVSKGLARFSASLPSHLPHHQSGSSVYLKDISAHKEEVRKENGYHE